MRKIAIVCITTLLLAGVWGPILADKPVARGTPELLEHLPRDPVLVWVTHDTNLDETFQGFLDLFGQFSAEWNEAVPEVALYFGSRAGLFELGGSAQHVRTALAGRGPAERLAAGEDFSFVASHLDPTWSSMTYVNPRPDRRLGPGRRDRRATAADVHPQPTVDRRLGRNVTLPIGRSKLLDRQPRQGR